MRVFAVETSCDETSASIIENGNKELSTVILSQMDIHKEYGGVVPEIASRNHTKNITMVFEEALEKAKLTMNDIDLVAVTSGPGLKGSLLVGIEAAKALAFSFNKPIIPINHIAGHIYANNLFCEMKFPLIALVISGGHTEIIYMKKHYSFEKIGSTLDDSIGEAYDKVARVLGVSYPGGPVIDKMAAKGNHTYDLPTPKDDDTYDFSFSGIKSAVINLVNKEKQKSNEVRKEDLAKSFQNTVVNIVVKKTMKAVKEYNVKMLLLSGGVSANSQIRKEFELKCKEESIVLCKPKIKYCTDNAAMIGTAAYFAYKDSKEYSVNLETDPGQKL